MVPCFTYLFLREKKTLECEILSKGVYEFLCSDILITDFGLHHFKTQVIINYFLVHLNSKLFI